MITRLLTSAAAVGTLVCMADRAAAAEPAQPAATADQAATEVGTIIVTAERREESLQKVPVSVTAVDSKQIERLFIHNLAGLTDLAPNFTIQGVGAVNRNGAVVYSRGIGFEGSGGVAPPIAVSIDGMFYAVNTGTLLNTYDVNRVEILEGPQGTLFGRNTVGGVIQIVTNDPTHDFEASGFVRAGNYGRFDTNVTANLPISDTLAARVSVNTQYSDGFYKNLYVDPVSGQSLRDTNTGGDNNQAIRGKLKWTPDDKLTVLLTGWYVTQHQDSPVGQNASDSTDAIFFRGLPDANATTTGRPGIGFLGGPTTPFVVHRDTNGADDLDQKGVVLDASYRTPWGFDLTSISSYMKYNTHNIDDFDGTDLNYFTSNILVDQSQFSQELRAQSNASDSKLKWQTGVYFFTTSFYTRQANIIGPSFFASGTNATSPTVTQLLGATEYNFNVAGFGQVDYEIIPNLILTAGGRYTYEHTRVTDYPALANILTPSPVPARTPLPNAANWGSFTYHLGAHYNINDDMMVYASYSTGDQAGGFSLTATTQSQMSPYSPEKADAFETGLRSEWLDHRLRVNVTGFWNNYSDLQVGAFRPVTGGTGQQAFIANSAFERARGVELETTVLPVKGLTLSASVGYLDARYTSFKAALSYNFPGHVCNGLTGGAGSPPIIQNHADPSTQCFLLPPLSPDVTARLDASYVADLGEHGSLTPHISWTTEGSYFTNLTNAPVGFQPGWSTLDADITYLDPSGRWRLSFYGKNLTNTIHLLNSNPIAGLFTVNYYADPRVFGVELGVKFR